MKEFAKILSKSWYEQILRHFNELKFKFQRNWVQEYIDKVIKWRKDENK